MSRIGFQHLAIPDKAKMVAFYRVAQPSIAKMVCDDRDFVRQCKVVSPKTFWIGRRYVADQKSYWDDMTPERGAEKFFGQVRGTGIFDLMDAWEGLNEMNPESDSRFDDWARFAIRYAALLHGEGKLCLEGNFGVGHPANNPTTWFAHDEVREALRAIDLFGYHGYACYKLDYDWAQVWHLWRPDMWWSLLPADCQKPVVFTEFGWDDIPRKDSNDKHITTSGGWKNHRQLWGLATNEQKEDEALRQFKWADGQLKARPWIKGALTYCMGYSDSQWQTYDHAAGTRLTGMMAQLMATADTTSDTITPEGWVDLRGKLEVHANLKYDTRTLDRITTIVIHHSDSPITTTPQQIAHYHVTDPAHIYPGIGYAFCIAADGTAYWTQPFEATSWHVASNNFYTIGVCLIGSFMGGKVPTAAQITSAKKAISGIQSRVGRTLRVVGHKDLVQPRDCPGDTWNVWRAKLVPTVLPSDQFKALMFSEATARRIDKHNEAAALTRYILSKGWAAMSDEYDVRPGLPGYPLAVRCQVALDTSNGILEWYVVYCPVGQWSVITTLKL